MRQYIRSALWRHGDVFVSRVCCPHLDLTSYVLIAPSIAAVAVVAVTSSSSTLSCEPYGLWGEGELDTDPGVLGDPPGIGMPTTVPEGESREIQVLLCA